MARKFPQRSNTGAGRDGRPRGEENVRTSFLQREGGDRPYRPRRPPTMKGANAHSVIGDRPQRPSIVNGDRPYRPRFNNNRGDRPQRPYNREGGSYDRPQRPSYNREGGDRPYVRDLIRILTAATVLNVLTTVKAANNG